MRLIDADALIEKAECLFKDLNSTEDYMGIGYNHGVGDCMAIIKNIPTIEAEPVRKGSYKVIYDPFMMRHKFECMECGHTFYIGNAGLEFDYCPKCGIKITRAETINAWTGEPETEDE